MTSVEQTARISGQEIDVRENVEMPGGGRASGGGGGEGEGGGDAPEQDLL